MRVKIILILLPPRLQHLVFVCQLPLRVSWIWMRVISIPSRCYFSLILMLLCVCHKGVVIYLVR